MAAQMDKPDALGRQVVDAAFKVHNELGPGLLESVYEHCLAYELGKRGIPVKRQVAVPVIYDGERMEVGLRLDLMVADQVIVEVKAVETMNPVFQAQILTYLRLTGLRLGYLMNFNVRLIKDGISRYAL